MAMSKKEREYVTELENRVRFTFALRWTPRVDPDIAPPAAGTIGKAISGFTPAPHAANDRILPAWSDSMRHGVGAFSRAEAPSADIQQRGLHLYSSDVLALRGLRNAVEDHAARRLAYIDAMIERALANPQTLNTQVYRHG